MKETHFLSLSYSPISAKVVNLNSLSLPSSIVAHLFFQKVAVKRGGKDRQGWRGGRVIEGSSFGKERLLFT
jgi:hypothetical protein